jgi:hypothetical protein
VAELEEENTSLRAALHLPPAIRSPLGRGPTGKDRPRTASATTITDVDKSRHPSSSITSAPRASVTPVDNLANYSESHMPLYHEYFSPPSQADQITSSPQSTLSHTSNTPSSQSSSLAYSPVSMRRTPSISPEDDSDRGTEPLDSPECIPADLEGPWSRSMLADDLEAEGLAPASSSSSMTTAPYKSNSLTLVPPQHSDMVRMSSSYPPSATHMSSSPATTSQSVPSPMPMFMSPQAELNCHYFGHRPEESRLALAYVNHDAAVPDLVESSAGTGVAVTHHRRPQSFPDQNTLSSHSFPQHHSQQASSTYPHDMSTESVPSHPLPPVFGPGANGPPRRLMMHHSSPPVLQMMDPTNGSGCNNNNTNPQSAQPSRPSLTFPHHAFSYSSPSMSNLTGHGSHVLQSTPGEGGSSSSGSTGSMASPRIVSLDGASNPNMMHFTRPSGMYSALLPDGQYHNL